MTFTICAVKMMATSRHIAKSTSENLAKTHIPIWVKTKHII